MRIVRLSSNNKQKQRGRVNDSDVAAQKHSQEQRALLSLLHASRIGAKANFAVGVAAACVHIFVSPCCSPGAPVRVPVCVSTFCCFACLVSSFGPLIKLCAPVPSPPRLRHRCRHSSAHSIKLIAHCPCVSVCVCVCVSE